MALLATAVIAEEEKPAGGGEPTPAVEQPAEPPGGPGVKAPPAGVPATPEEKGESRFFIGLEVWGAELSSFDLALATTFDVTGCNDANGDLFCDYTELVRSGGGSVGIDKFNLEPSYSVEAGWRFPGGNRIGGRYWRFEPSGDSVSGDSAFDWTHPGPSGDIQDVLGGVVPLMGSPTVVSDEFGTLPYHVEGSAEARAQSADVFWARRHPLRGGWEVDWKAGVRWLSFETEASVLYRTDTPDARFSTPPPQESMVEEKVSFSSKTDGIGPIVGGEFTYRFGRNQGFGVHGRFEAAGVFAGTDWRLRGDRCFYDFGFQIPCDTPTNLAGNKSDRTVFTLEGDVGISYRFKHFQVQGGWRAASWEDAWTNVGVLDPADPSMYAFTETPSQVEINGAYFGISWGF